MRVLNVGGGAGRDLPRAYKGWDQDLLDIDPAVKPDIVWDAKELHRLPRAKYDAVYCSHNLEHFYKHEVPRVLAGMRHVLKPRGFANISVPDMSIVFAALANRDIDDTWYVAAGNHAVSFHDVIYGWGREVARGNLHYVHKTGFTAKSLGVALRAAGFAKVLVASDDIGNLHAFAFKSVPARAELARLGI